MILQVGKLLFSSKNGIRCKKITKLEIKFLQLKIKVLQLEIKAFQLEIKWAQLEINVLKGWSQPKTIHKFKIGVEAR
jgi:hypothetical protein